MAICSVVCWLGNKGSEGGILLQVLKLGGVVGILFLSVLVSALLKGSLAQLTLVLQPGGLDQLLICVLRASLCEMPSVGCACSGWSVLPLA